MRRGRRYDNEPKLNIQKVIAVVIAIIVLIMIILILKGIFANDNSSDRIVAKSYFAIYRNEKWGVIDSTGNVVIHPAYTEMIVVPDNKQDVFICTYDVDYQTGEFKTKALNSKNKEIFTEYQEIGVISNKDINNNLWYESDVLKVKKDGKYGLINMSGKVLTEFVYDDIVAVLGVENSYKTYKDGKYGIINSDGKIVVENKYADITNIGTDNKSGFIVKEDNGKYGLIDYSKNQILEAKYDSVKNVYGNDLYVVVENGKQKIVNKEAQDVITEGFDEVSTISENGIIFIKSGKYGAMKESAEIIIDAEYEYLAQGKSGIFVAKKDGKYGIIDESKIEKLPFEYQNITYNKKADFYITEDNNFNSKILNSNFETKIEGILVSLDIEKGYIKMKINDEYKYYNLKFEQKSEIDIFPNRTLFLSKKDGKYGFIDKEGKVIIDYIYDDATEQNNYGFSAIKKDGKWGCVDSKGKIIQQPRYDLTDYLLVDFIGNWHLGLDLNMNYYNQE